MKITHICEQLWESIIEYHGYTEHIAFFMLAPYEQCDYLLRLATTIEGDMFKYVQYTLYVCKLSNCDTILGINLSKIYTKTIKVNA